MDINIRSDYEMLLGDVIENWDGYNLSFLSNVYEEDLFKYMSSKLKLVDNRLDAGQDGSGFLKL